MLSGWKSLYIQNNSFRVDLSEEEEEKKTWTTVEDTIRRIKLWGRNRSFIGLTSWMEELF